jgi:1L-myo-inositol 1-phosphate cytidylyltransferase / CDP-L-myo-inositol myo-inositolphosphotransferase
VKVEPTNDRGELRDAAEELGRSPRARVGVLLAAGRSERMRSATQGGSKALVRLGGISLLQRAIRTLEAAGIERIVVVVGHQAGPVATVARTAAPDVVQICYAEQWELGNGASLAATEPFVAEEPSFLLVTVDHVFEEGTLEALLTAGGPAVLVDSQPADGAWDEGTRVRLRGRHAVQFSKELGDPSIDCGAFVLTPAVFDAHRRAAVRGSHALADAVTELAAESPLAVVPVGSSWWLDVDTPQDLRSARRILRRSLSKEGDGPVSRYLNRPISTRLSMALAPLRPNPDLVSWIVLAVAMLAAWLLWEGHAVAAGLLVQLTSILDGVDGELARLQLRAGPGGALLDGVLDRISDAAIIAAMSVWAIHQSEPATTVVMLAVAATAGAMLSMAVKDRIAALGLPPAPERGLSFLLAGRDGRFLLLAVAAVLGRPLLGLVAVAATSAITLLLRVALVRAWISRGRPSSAPIGR